MRASREELVFFSLRAQSFDRVKLLVYGGVVFQDKCMDQLFVLCIVFFVAVHKTHKLCGFGLASASSLSALRRSREITQIIALVDFYISILICIRRVFLRFRLAEKFRGSGFLLCGGNSVVAPLVLSSCDSDSSIMELSFLYMIVLSFDTPHSDHPPYHLYVLSIVCSLLFEN